MKRSLWIVALLVTWAAPVPADEKKADGTAVYKDKCSFCHGSSGTPLPALAKKGARDFTDAEWAKSVSDDQIRSVILDGSEGTLMRSFKKELSPDEIEAVAAYVRTLSKKKDGAGATPRRP